MIIRNSTPNDSESIFKLLVDAFTEGYRKKFPEITIDESRINGFRNAVASDPNSQWIVAESEGTTVGAIRLLTPPLAEVWLPNALEMKGLVLAPHLQGQGLGRQLMESLKSTLTDTDVRFICGRVRKEATELRTYYETYGCRPDSNGDQTLPNVNLVGYVYDLKSNG